MQPWLPHGHDRAAALDDHVADLAGRAAPVPAACRRGSARRRRPSPRRRRGSSRGSRPAPSSYSAQVATSTSLPTATLVPSVLREVRRRAGSSSAQSGRFLAFETAPEPRVDLARRADPDPAQRRSVSVPARLAASRSAAAIASATLLRTAVVRGRAARLADDVVLGVDDDRLDLRPAEVDPAAPVALRRSVSSVAPASSTSRSSTRAGAPSVSGQPHRQADQLVGAGLDLAQVEALERDDAVAEQLDVGVVVADREVVDRDQPDSPLEDPGGTAAVEADEVVGELVAVPELRVRRLQDQPLGSGRDAGSPRGPPGRSPRRDRRSRRPGSGRASRRAAGRRRRRRRRRSGGSRRCGFPSGRPSSGG